ncbi:MAG: nucleotide sugar dehydrogenase, partial [Candidatus Altiarchaeales archaeon]|nr:nucleotide sugar dehydrogenase [Candidatus Altiarchaeales archaeon]
ENIQRDLNIALMNELSLIFNRMGLNTTEVIEAASTKWNFHPYKPGLVGGHCIPVDPYYLLHKAQELGYSPQVILAGRNINDSMPEYVAKLALEGLKKAGKNPGKCKILIMGLTFKENVRDYRTTPAKGVISTLKKHGVEVVGLDPMLENKVIEKEFGVRAVTKLSEKFDVVILAVKHDAFKTITLGKLKDCMTSKPVLIDVRGFYSQKEALNKGFTYKQL